MLFRCCKYLFHIKHKSTVIIGLLLIFALSTNAQQDHLTSDSNTFPLNPMLRLNYKPPLKANQQLAAYIRPSKHELMYWPNFPLNAAQVEARDREWERENNRPLGEKIASDIIKNTINTLIFGKKPVAAVPKF
jgi:methylglyoxal synthase